jgi:hypothetical protein
MRQPQQNKNRMRNRRSKQTNPLNRNFESNGPDVKIRGNAAHIAEKYTSLARDAQSSGDHVMAENYLQHAEHYNRLIAAANAQKEANRSENQPQPDFSNDDDGQDQPAANDDGNNREEVAASAPEDEGNKRNRRERRPRKPRNNDQGDQDNAGSEAAEASSDADSADDASGGKQASNGNGNGRRRSRPRDDKQGGKQPGMEGVSEDAAGLPESILGGAA